MHHGYKAITKKAALSFVHSDISTETTGAEEISLAAVILGITMHLELIRNGNY